MGLDSEDSGYLRDIGTELTAVVTGLGAIYGNLDEIADQLRTANLLAAISLGRLTEAEKENAFNEVRAALKLDELTS